jgi:hypothetical protein
MILTLTSIIIAAGCYAVSQSVIHGKFNLYGGSFWGNEGWRKYANPIDAPKDNWYYRYFKIGYKERFPLSATLLVFVTDAYHLFQMIFKIFLCLAFVQHIGWIWSGVLWIVFGVAFTLVYKYSQK